MFNSPSLIVELKSCCPVKATAFGVIPCNRSPISINIRAKILLGPSPKRVGKKALFFS
jgi:hypothetical protein